MSIRLHKTKILEKGHPINLSCGYLLARVDYESPTADQEINLDLSAFLLDCDGKIPSADHFVFYNNHHSSDGSVEWFDDGRDPYQTHEMTLGLDLSAVGNEVFQIVIILTIHEAKIKHQNISQLIRPYIRFCDGEKELYRFETVGDESSRSLEFCRILRKDSTWILVATGVGSSNELGDYVPAHLQS